MKVLKYCWHLLENFEKPPRSLENKTMPLSHFCLFFSFLLKDICVGTAAKAKKKHITKRKIIITTVSNLFQILFFYATFSVFPLNKKKIN